MSDSKEIFELVHLAKGQGPALVTAREDGQIVAIKANVELSIQNGGVVEMPGGHAMITAAGYDLLNQVAGISVIPTRTVGVPGKGEQPNPYVLYDERMSPRIVYARVAAVGYTPAGNIAVVDQTLHFDLEAYKQRDAMARIKWYPRFGKLCHRSEIDPKNKGYFMPVLDQDYGIWLDTTAPSKDTRKKCSEFFCWLENVMQRQQFADRIAMGFLRRNALRHHPAIGQMRVQLENGKCSIPVMAWRKDLPEERIREIADGRRDETIEVKATIIDTEQMAEENGDAIIEEAVEDSGDLKERNEAVSSILGSTKIKTEEPPEPIEPPKVEKSPRQVAMEKINAMRKKMGEEKWKEFWDYNVTSGRTLEQFKDNEVVRFEDMLDRHCFEQSIT